MLLNACEGARPGQQDLLASTAATLINSGVPAVLAMQYEVADSAAVEFSTTFYESLADNLPVDAAVAEARNAINFRNARSLEWAIPVLHMRAPDGQLFSVTGANQAANPHAPLVARNEAQSSMLPTLPMLKDDKSATISLKTIPFYNPKDDAQDDPNDDLGTLLSAVEQQGRHLEFSENAAPLLEKPIKLVGQPATNGKAAASSTKLSALTGSTASQFDISDLLQSYAQRHQSIIGFDWVSIPGGDFLMGSDPARDIHLFEDELPQLKLYLPSFRISRFSITNAQYKLFVDATEHRSPSHWSNGEIPPAKDKHPVVNVSWRDATAFCEWAGVRLPTEAEWEKVARGRDGRLYPWGDTPPTQERCNFDSHVNATSAVGNYPAGASPYGALDMAGNVWEWTASVWLDCYENYTEQMENSSENNLRRVLRGGGFRDFELVRCAARSWDLATQRYRDLSFRVVALEA